MREDAILRSLNCAVYTSLSIAQFNAAKKYGENGVFIMNGSFPSTGWWLGSSAVYLMAIDYKAKCQRQKIYYKDVKIKYEWHDNIDGNSFVESYKAGNLFSSIGGLISNTIEGTWDLIMEKIASVDYKIIIKGNASIPDGNIAVRINDN